MTFRSLAQTLLMTAAPAGGQSTARRNAWAAMSEDAVRARGRRDARVALAAAERQARRVSRTGS